MNFVHVIFSAHKYMQVWSILDLHYLNICSSIYWHLCDICSTQAEEQGMELWHKSGDLVCWFVLWLRYRSSSLPVCNPQILLCTSGPCATILSIWVFPVCLYSGPGMLLFFIFMPQILRKHEIWRLLCIVFSKVKTPLFYAVYVRCATGYI